MEMTQQYLAGELSLRLGQLQAAAASRGRAREVARLRREAETVPLAALGCVALRALELADGMCWGSLVRGDGAAFSRQAAICAELWEFAICADLLEEGVSALG